MNAGMCGQFAQFARTIKNVLCFGLGINSIAYTAGASLDPFPTDRT